jgi:transcription elongation factor S-II
MTCFCYFFQIITAIADSLSLDVDGKKITNPVAFPLAFGVEYEIDVLFPFHRDLKGYQNKSRNIFFSLKSNAELRQDLLEARLTVTDLLRLPKEQLATRAMREKAQKENEDMMMAKRNDYFTITRDQTMLEIGLDPNAGGEHTCSKCKGQKTSSYSLQTRSADEPMTGFITCLTCGKRWRIC